MLFIYSIIWFLNLSARNSWSCASYFSLGRSVQAHLGGAHIGDVVGKNAAFIQILVLTISYDKYFVVVVLSSF